jgi:NAD(P)-dependent dehydrogenase (short-subunit alcohol dehydrogenase family)
VTTISWNFEGKTALVTGASRGIGLATANLLAGAGADVFALSRSAEPSDENSKVHVLTVDVTNADQLARAAEDAARSTGGIDICVANAGVGFVEHYVRTDPADWSRVIDVNLLGVMRVWQAVLPHMGKDGRSGRLVANSSAAGVRGEPGTATYSASKAAISGLVQALAIEYADRAITVNAVAPGEIDTLLNREGRQTAAERGGTSAEQLLEDLIANHIPVRRLGSADEVAGLIAFLASDEAAYMTGQTVVIDGGQLLV